MGPCVKVACLCASLLSPLLLTGCYEGWQNYQQQQPAPGAPNPSTPNLPTRANNRFAYLLFEPISMGSDAVVSPTCMPKTGIAQFKSTEWSSRISSITAALANVADTVVVKTDSIPAGDCTVLATVQAAALATMPWLPNTAPPASSNKEVIHLKAVFWEGEPNLAPPPAVTATDWNAWTTLSATGSLPTKSLLYFVVSNPVSGYFTQWEAAIPGPQKLDGTAINTVDPTTAGTTARSATITTDTNNLITWLGGQ